MTDVKSNLVDLSDYVYERSRRRLDGLTDEEYLWEPAPGCWSVRPAGDGTYHADYSVLPDPPPFTTIAWRLCHLIACYGGRRNAVWLGVEVVPAFAGLGGAAAGTAAEAIDLLERAHATWRAVLTNLPEAQLAEKLGPSGGQYADHDKASFVLHMLDEFIHHGAEVAVLRDLYRATRDTESDPLVVALLSGDPAAVDARRAADPGGLDRVRAEHPDLLERAAANGRWAVVPLLVELGFKANGSGFTALHHAAGAGRLDVVRLLVEHGSNLAARDPEYDATPLEWAEYFRETPVVEYLKGVSR